jgi:hypothetical protein
VVLVSPAVALASDGWVRRLLGQRGNARDISPDEHVRRGLPPTLILEGSDDTVTPLAGVKRFCERLRAAGNLCELQVYEGFGHLFTPKGIPDDGMPEPDPATSADASARTDRFLESLGFMEKIQRSPLEVPGGKDGTMQGEGGELERISYDLLDAIRTRDRERLDGFLAPDFVQVNDVGARLGKEAFISAIEAGDYRIEELAFEFLSVERLDRVGVVCGVQRARVRMPGGEEIVGRTAFTDVFVRGDDRWQLRIATSAELAEPTS